MELVLAIGTLDKRMNAVRWNPTSNDLAGAWDYSVGVHESGTTKTIFFESDWVVETIEWSPSGEMLAASTDWGEVWISRSPWKSMGRQLNVPKVKGRNGARAGKGFWDWSLCWSPDSKKLLTYARGGQAIIWDTSSLKKVQMLNFCHGIADPWSGFSAPGGTAQWSADGEWILSSHHTEEANVIQCWDTKKYGCFFERREKLTFGDGGAVIMPGAEKVFIRHGGPPMSDSYRYELWNVRHSSVEWVFTSHEGFSFVFSPDGARLAMFNQSGLGVWDTSDWSLTYKQDCKVSNFVWGPDKDRLAFLSDGSLWFSGLGGFGSLHQTTINGQWRDLSWNYDGSRLAFHNNGALYTLLFSEEDFF